MSNSRTSLISPRGRAISRRASLLAAIATLVAGLTPAASALASSSGARSASRSERTSILKAYAANDGGSTSSVNGVYVSRSNASLAVVCERTPEAGEQTFVFGHSRGSWRYLAGGSRGRAGNAADRRLELACP